MCTMMCTCIVMEKVPYGGFFSRITNFANFAEKFVIREIYFLEF